LIEGHRKAYKDEGLPAPKRKIHLRQVAFLNNRLADLPGITFAEYFAIVGNEAHECPDYDPYHPSNWDE